MGAIEFAEDDRSKVRNITVYWQVKIRFNDFDMKLFHLIVKMKR